MSGRLLTFAERGGSGAQHAALAVVKIAEARA